MQIVEKINIKPLSPAWMQQNCHFEDIPDNSLFIIPKNEHSLLNDRYVKFEGKFHKQNGDLIKEIETIDTQNSFHVLAININSQDMKNIKHSFDTAYHNKLKESMVSYELSKEDKDIFLSLGIKAEPVWGKGVYLQQASRVFRDGIQYAIPFNNRGFMTKNEIINKRVKLLKSVQRNFHKPILKIYQHLKFKNNIDNVWVIIDDKDGLKAYFGCKDGYIATLSLGQSLYLDNLTNKDYFKDIKL